MTNNQYIKKTALCRLTMGATFLFAGIALGRPGLDLIWNTIDGGGATFSTGGGFSLGGTIGQPDAGSALSGGSFSLIGGFWPVERVCYCPGDLNSDGAKNGLDVQQFLNCVVASGAGNCTCADMDGIGGVSLSDVSAFVSDLLSGVSCP